MTHFDHQSPQGLRAGRFALCILVCLALLTLSACDLGRILPGLGPTKTPRPTSTARPTRTPYPTVTPRHTAVPTATPIPTDSPTPTPLPTATSTPTPLPSQVPLDAPLLTQGDGLVADGDFDGALVLYNRLLNEQPSGAVAGEAVLHIAQAYLQKGEPDTARAWIEANTALFSWEENHRAHFLLAEAYGQLGNCQQAGTYYQLYRDEGTSLDAFIAEGLAWCYRSQGDLARSAEEFTRAAGTGRYLSNRASFLEEAIKDLRALGDSEGALARYEQILAVAAQPAYRASTLYAMGDLLNGMGRTDEAWARWQEALSSYPSTEGASWAADALLAAGATVDPYQVALAYRAVGRTSDALPWFEQAVQANPSSTEIRYALAGARADSGDLQGALDEMYSVYQLNTDDPEPLLREARLLQNVGESDRAMEQYREIINLYPQSSQAGEAMYRCGQIRQAQGQIDNAVSWYTDLLNQFPDHTRAAEARFQAGFERYAQGNYAEAAAILSGGSDSRAALWQGLALSREGLPDEARQAWTTAAAGAGYYAARAGELLQGGPGFGHDSAWPTWPDGVALEQVEAEAWLSGQFSQTVTSTLPVSLAQDPLFMSGDELLRLGEVRKAREPLDLLVDQVDDNGPFLYPLALYLRDHGIYFLSIHSAERIVALTTERDDQVPRYIQRLLYPTPFAQLIVPDAQDNGVDPLAFFALARQESRFDPFATSWVDARGLTQVMPSTAEGIAVALGYTDYRLSDLYRPLISIRFGTWYLGQEVARFGETIPALAGYNGGPGNAIRWAGGTTFVSDMDLFVEAVDYSETSNYIKVIYTSYWRYRQLYVGE